MPFEWFLSAIFLFKGSNSCKCMVCSSALIMDTKIVLLARIDSIFKIHAVTFYISRNEDALGSYILHIQIVTMGPPLASAADLSRLTLVAIFGCYS
jgi:hypothetical protein